MEILKKIISTDEFIRRVPDRIDTETNERLPYPSFDGKYGSDIIVQDETIKKLLPVDSDGRLRYRIFCKYYYITEDFRQKAKIYKNCLRGWQISDEDSDSVITENMRYNIYASIDEIVDSEEEKVIIFDKAEKIKTLISSEPSLISNIVKIRNFCCSCFGIDAEYTKIPYISVPLFLRSETNDGGKIESSIPQWISGKKYLEGQFVIYGDRCYKAKKDISERKNIMTPSENAEYWIVIEEKPTEKRITISGITESHLSIFLTKRLYVDETYETNPFWVDSDGDICFPYLKGEAKDGNAIGRLREIYCNGDDSRVMKGTKFREIYYYLPQNLSSVTFIYDLVEKSSDNISAISYDGAITYKETYAVAEEMSKTVNGKEQKYFTLSTGNTLNASETNIDAIDSQMDTINAEVEYTIAQKEYDTDIADILNTFVKISPLGAQDIKMDIDANIDRGKSALFERMNILGEIKSLNDLENYRNNYFDI